MKSKKNKKFKTNKDQNRQSKSNLPKKISINRMIKHLLANNKFHEIQIARVEIFLKVLNRLKWLFETFSENEKFSNFLVSVLDVFLPLKVLMKKIPNILVKRTRIEKKKDQTKSFNTKQQNNWFSAKKK